MMRSRAAVAWAGSGAALSGLAALAAWGFAPRPPEVIDVVVPAGAHRSGPEWLRVRSLSVPYQHHTWAPKTALVSPSLALILAYGTVPERDRAQLVYGAARARLVDAARLEHTLAGLPHVAARASLATRIARLEAGAESYLEERGMAKVFRGQAFDDLVFQHRLRVRGIPFRLDALHVPTLTAFELDGGTHDEPDVRQRDVTRDGLIATLGYLTVRYTYNDVTSRPGWCRELAREVIATRANKA